jgi:hypothetical protein
MATLETIMEHLRRTEREQKVRDEGLRRAFHDYANTIDRFIVTMKDLISATRLPMQMEDFTAIVTKMLAQQQELLQWVGTRADDGDDGVDADEAWDNAFPDENLPPEHPHGQ